MHHFWNRLWLFRQRAQLTRFSHDVSFCQPFATDFKGILKKRDSFSYLFWSEYFHHHFPLAKNNFPQELAKMNSQFISKLLWSIFYIIFLIFHLILFLLLPSNAFLGVSIKRQAFNNFNVNRYIILATKCKRKFYNFKIIHPRRRREEVFRGLASWNETIPKFFFSFHFKWNLQGHARTFSMF